MALITLTTDFGNGSPYVAEMKAAIYRINPAATIVDVTHAIEPQSIRHGALVIDDVLLQFPHGSIHVIVVDPGVGTEREIVLAAVQDHWFICPNNGLLHLLTTNWAEAFVNRIDNPEFWRANTSATFHGRDIMAPVAAHLSLGANTREIAPTPTNLVPLNLPAAKIESQRIEGLVSHLDSFGNLITNIPMDAVSRMQQPVEIEVGGHRFAGVETTYGNRPAGTAIALCDSHGRLEIAIVNGNAAKDLEIGPDAPVTVKHRSL